MLLPQLFSGSLLRAGEILGHESHCHRSFAHGRSHAIHRARADVTGGKDARNTCLERRGLSFFLPDAAKRFVQYRIVSGQHEALLISQDWCG
jgi:hypothetical protein